jgi:hypothetical protein
LEQLFGDLDSRTPRHAGAQKDGNQFGRAERVRAQGGQAFAWPFIFWKVFDADSGSHAEYRLITGKAWGGQ